MNVKNCRRCGRLFNYVTGPYICPMCREENEKKFQEVKKYIQTHPRCSMQAVCEECDVEAGQIQNWIRQERLQFADDSPIKVACENCGAMIGSGKLCEKCKNAMTKNLNNMMNKSVDQLKQEPVRPPKDKNRMRFL
ncbi:MAG: flagellar protein [Lachnospiraceae bacterium]